MGSRTYVYTQLYLSVKYDTVLFPFDVVAFIRGLPGRGYILSERFDTPIPLGTRLSASGIVARRGDTGIRLETERQIVGVSATDITTLMQELDAVESIIKEDLDLDNSAIARYYEFLSGFTVKAEKNPLIGWKNLFENTPIIGKFSEVIGDRVSPFGIRVTPSEESPNQAKWVDIHIEPHVQSPESRHQVEVVWRHPDRDKVYNFVKGFEDLIDSLLSLVEEG